VQTLRHVIRLLATAALVTVLLAPAADGRAHPAHAKAKAKAERALRTKCLKARSKRVRAAACRKVCTKKAKVRPPAKVCKKKPAPRKGSPATAPTPSASAVCCTSPTAQSSIPTRLSPVSWPAGESAWDKPALNNPTTVVVDASHRDLKLDTGRDYILQFGPGVTTIAGGVSIWGGHNVVIDGGHLDVPDAAGGMVVKNQTGTFWLHNFHISGPLLQEGIDLDQRQPASTVVIRNVLIDTVHGSFATNHADLIQSWAGPSRLLIDGLSGTTDYQGFFLLPNQFQTAWKPAVFDIRHVDIANNGGYALWRDAGNPYPLYTDDVYIRPNPQKISREWWLWPKPSTGDHSWDGVIAGTPDGGSFVSATDGGATGISDVEPPRARPGTPQQP
jgi:hypothetical protein